MINRLGPSNSKRLDRTWNILFGLSVLASIARLAGWISTSWWLILSPFIALLILTGMLFIPTRR